MLERLLSGWTAKFLVLVLLGFAATDFIITQTLSAADAAEHLIHNPFWSGAPGILQSQMVLTMGMLVLLGGMFLRGFKEVIAIAVVIVGVYLTLNVIVLVSGVSYLAFHPSRVAIVVSLGAERRLAHAAYRAAACLGPRLLACLIFFPKLALGLKRF